MRQWQRRVITLGFASLALIGSEIFVRPDVRAEELPGAIADHEFWRMLTEYSEPGGVFQQEFMSNEDSLQFVIPALKRTAPADGVYIGVGAEQNFTYIAAVKPRMAFVVDIRRDNMLQLLMYKALFELSADRAAFVSQLFARKRPAGLDANSSVTALFAAYESAPSDHELFQENVRAVIECLEQAHKFPLSQADKDAITGIMYTFGGIGPYRLRGQGDRNLSYAQMMAAGDLEGHQQSFLASEENFRTIRELQKQNLIVPLVGDFAGDKALASIGRYLKERGAIVNVFYVSNVERYLFEQGERGMRFYPNVATLPLDGKSTFIRSVTVDISRRLGIRLPDAAANWRSFLVPIRDSLKAREDGRLRTYRDLFESR
jgi:hypothetical protein